MIKVGTKVFCIEDVFFPNSNKKYFANGSQYEIKNVSIDEYTNNYYVDIYGCYFYLEDKNRSYKKFSEHFITIAEWRDKQINKILEDE
jgi:hypothetical protein